MTEPLSGRKQLVRVRKHFSAMVLTYSLGAFNDNFFKQAVLLLGVTVGLNEIQGRAIVVFSLPFVLFSAWGGWLADRFAKKKVVIGAKIFELAVMLMGAYGVFTLNWNWLLFMLFCMGLQSTLFGPALNGSIPELYAQEQVIRANGMLKTATTGASLLGMAMAGFCLDQQWVASDVPFGRIVVAVLMVLFGLLGLVVSLGVFSRSAAAPHAPFPLAGPLNSLVDLIRLKSDFLLLFAICCDSFFYFISLLVLLVINTLGVQQLGLSTSATSMLSVSLMVGVCIGSLTAAKVTTHERWTHVLLPAAIGMGGSLFGAGFLVSCGADQFLLLLVLLLLAGLSGGLFLVPLSSFVQIRPACDSKGRILGVSNFVTLSCMLLAGMIFPLLDRSMLPSQAMSLLGGIFMLAGGVIYFVLRALSKHLQ